MTIPPDMQELANAIMADWGVPALYRPTGQDPAEEVTVRCKPRFVVVGAQKTRVMDISVRATEVAMPEYGDTFEIDGELWRLSALPSGDSEINSHACGALWQLTLVRDARPGRK